MLTTSPFCSPLFVKKKDDITVKDSFLILTVDEFLDEFHGASHFRSWTCVMVHQILVTPRTDTTAFCTHHGLYKWLIMYFDLTDSPTTYSSTFCTNMSLCICDDILVFSPSWSSHVVHLLEVCCTSTVYMPKHRSVLLASPRLITLDILSLVKGFKRMNPRLRQCLDGFYLSISSSSTGFWDLPIIIVDLRSIVHHLPFPSQSY
jgi:hypothetical protein